MYTVASPGGDEKPVVLLDPNKLSEDGTVSGELFLSLSCAPSSSSLPCLSRARINNTIFTARSLWAAPPSATTAR